MGAGNRSTFQTVAWTATAIFILFGIVGDGPSTYRFAVLFLGPLLWAVYFLRQYLHIHPVHFGIFAAALVFHNLGAFGTYRQAFLGIQFDTYVHFVFGVAGTLLVARTIRFRLGLEGWQLWIGAILLILGLSAVHELIEFASTLMLGPEKGMLKINDPDKFDTQKDLLNNLVGAILALAFYTLGSRGSVRNQNNGIKSERANACAERA